MKPSLLTLSAVELSEWLKAQKIPAYRAAQIRQWTIRDAVTSFDACAAQRA